MNEFSEMHVKKHLAHREDPKGQMVMLPVVFASGHYSLSPSHKPLHKFLINNLYSVARCGSK